MKRLNLWPTFILAVAIGCALAILSHKADLSPAMAEVGEIIRRLST